jgi:Ni,Fe-hydrogenase III small subunit/ferredoxin
MPWFTRGLREGVVTSPYPRRPDDYGPRFRATATVLTDNSEPLDDPSAQRAVADCPTRAISLDESGLRLDRAQCIACGRCAEIAPQHFAVETSPEISVLRRDLLVVPSNEGSKTDLHSLRSELALKVRALRRSIHVRHVDCGSDGSEEWEIAALNNPIYDVQRLGIFFTASPRHADLLMVTGSGALGMAEPVVTTFEAMPEPKIVIGVGTDALGGGLVEGGYATRSGAGDILPLDVLVPGSPPSPFSILHGILLAVGFLRNIKSGTGKTGTGKTGIGKADEGKTKTSESGIRKPGSGTTT